MRSHATIKNNGMIYQLVGEFQYRKRYEVTCDYADWFLSNNPQ